MRRNTVKDRFISGQPIINGWVSIPCGYAAEIIASQGFDAVTVDMQHGMMGFETAMTMLQAIGATSAMPMVRCSSMDGPQIMRLLDAGAYGVICPSVDTPELARAFVDCCRYPPSGTRSFGPARGLLYGGSDYFDHANDHILALAMIESVEALEHLDAILDTPGLDGIYIGPNDLALSMGLRPGSEHQEAVAKAIGDVLQATLTRKLLAGIFCGSATLARQRLEQGFHLVTPGNDANMLSSTCRARIEETLGGAASGATPGPSGY